MGGGIDEIYRFVDTDRVFCHFRISPIITIGINLVIHTVCPVVVRHITILTVDIPRNIVFPPEMQGWCVGRIVGDILIGPYPDTGDTLTFVIGWRTRSWLIVVIDYIHFHTFTTIASITAEIIDHIVSHVHTLV